MASDSSAIKRLVSTYGDLRRRPRRDAYTTDQAEARRRFASYVQPAIATLTASGRWEPSSDSSHGEWYLKPTGEAAALSVYVTPADWYMTVAFQPREDARGGLRMALRSAHLDPREERKWDAKHDMRVSQPLSTLLGGAAPEEWTTRVSAFVVRAVRAVEAAG